MVNFYGQWRFDTSRHSALNFALRWFYTPIISSIIVNYRGMSLAIVDTIKVGEVALNVDKVDVYEPLQGQ